jgi:hypothetical protein
MEGSVDSGPPAGARQRWQTLQRHLDQARDRLDAGDPAAALAHVDAALAVDGEFLAALVLREQVEDALRGRPAFSMFDSEDAAEPHAQSDGAPNAAADRRRPASPRAAGDDLRDGAGRIDDPELDEKIAAARATIARGRKADARAAVDDLRRAGADPGEVALLEAELLLVGRSRGGGGLMRGGALVAGAATIGLIVWSVALLNTSGAASAGAVPLDSIASIGVGQLAGAPGFVVPGSAPRGAPPALPPGAAAETSGRSAPGDPAAVVRQTVPAPAIAAPNAGSAVTPAPAAAPPATAGPARVPLPEGTTAGVPASAAVPPTATQSSIDETSAAAAAREDAGPRPALGRNETSTPLVQPEPRTEVPTPDLQANPPAPAAAAPRQADAAADAASTNQAGAESRAPAQPAQLAALVPPRAELGGPIGTPVPPAVPRPPDDRALIGDLLQRYRAAYDSLDARSARAVYPQVDEQALARAFEALEAQTLTFQDCAVDLQGAAASAVCKGSMRYVPKVGSREPRLEPRVWTFRLRKTGSEWRIENARAGAP